MSSSTAAITEAEVRELAEEFYSNLAAHVSLDRFFPLLAEHGLVMKHPNADLHGRDGFAQWYDQTIHRFFDESHTVTAVKITDSISPEECEAEVAENWQASFWNPPGPSSQRIVVDTNHVLGLCRSPSSGKPVIVTYAVVSVEYAPGSARL